MHGFTYSGHPVGGAVGLANLDIMEREGLVEHAAEVGAYLLERLRERARRPPACRRGARRGPDARGRVRRRRKTKRFFDPTNGRTA